MKTLNLIGLLLLLCIGMAVIGHNYDEIKSHVRHFQKTGKLTGAGEKPVTGQAHEAPAAETPTGSAPRGEAKIDIYRSSNATIDGRYEGRLGNCDSDMVLSTSSYTASDRNKVEVIFEKTGTNCLETWKASVPLTGSTFVIDRLHYYSATDAALTEAQRKAGEHDALCNLHITIDGDSAIVQCPTRNLAGTLVKVSPKTKTLKKGDESGNETISGRDQAPQAASSNAYPPRQEKTRTKITPEQLIQELKSKNPLLKGQIPPPHLASANKSPVPAHTGAELPKSDSDLIKASVRKYYELVQRKDVNRALGCYASERRLQIKRSQLDAVAKDTEYYLIENINVIAHGPERAKAVTSLKQKKYAQPIETWEVSLEFVKEAGQWRIWSTPGKKTSPYTKLRSRWRQ